MGRIDIPHPSIASVVDGEWCTEPLGLDIASDRRPLVPTRNTATRDALRLSRVAS